MSFGFPGIQFGWTLQMNNMSPIYEYVGAALLLAQTNRGRKPNVSL